MAKRYAESVLKFSKDITVGGGPQGPLDHLFKLKRNVYHSRKLQPLDPDDLFLYAVTDSGMNKKWGHSITDSVRAAIEGGATIVQLRFSFLYPLLSLLFFFFYLLEYHVIHVIV